MRTAQDIMTHEVITISPEADITEAARILLDKGVNGLPVVDGEGSLVGIICQSDLVRMQKSLPIRRCSPCSTGSCPCPPRLFWKRRSNASPPPKSPTP